MCVFRTSEQFVPVSNPGLWVGWSRENLIEATGSLHSGMVMKDIKAVSSVPALTFPPVGQIDSRPFKCLSVTLFATICADMHTITFYTTCYSTSPKPRGIPEQAAMHFLTRMALSRWRGLVQSLMNYFYKTNLKYMIWALATILHLLIPLSQNWVSPTTKSNSCKKNNLSCTKSYISQKNPQSLEKMFNQ